jgi:DNA-binding NarL/FixJ family response regulator
MVLAFLAEGLTNREIAQRLGTSFRNVEKYVRRLLNKKGLSSRIELVNLAVESSQYQGLFSYSLFAVQSW